MRRRPALLAAATALTAAACSLPRPADVPGADAGPPTFVVDGTMASMWPGASADLLLTTTTTTEHVQVSANGAFSFTTALRDGDTYEVTIATPPVHHTCRVDAGSGTVHGANPMVHVDCRAIDVHLSIGSDWTFDPASFDQSVATSTLARETTVTVDAPDASDLRVNTAALGSGAESPAIAIGAGTTMITIDATIGGASHRYTISLQRGAHPIAQTGYLKASNTEAGDQFGAAVAAWSSWIAVGAPGEDSDATTIDGDGSNNLATDSGAVYLFHRTGATWQLVHYIKPWRGNVHGFGRSVALTRQYLAVGAATSVFVFGFDGGTVTHGGEAFGTNTEAADDFGASISLDGNVLAVGAPGEDSAATTLNGDGTDNSSTDSGAIYLFTLPIFASATQFAYIKAADNTPDAKLGASLALATLGPGQFELVIGAPGMTVGGTSGVGLVYGLEDNNGTLTWSSSKGAQPPGHAIGSSVAFDPRGGVIAAGGQNDSGGAAGWSVWGLGFADHVLTPSSSTPSPAFGSAVAVSGSLIVVTDPTDDNAGVGVDAPSSGPPRLTSGAAHLFEIDGTKLTSHENSFIKAANSRRGLQFGGTATLTSNTLVIGAPHEASSATSSGGNPFDVSAPDAGAAYVFQ